MTPALFAALIQIMSSQHRTLKLNIRPIGQQGAYQQMVPPIPVQQSGVGRSLQDMVGSYDPTAVTSVGLTIPTTATTTHDPLNDAQGWEELRSVAVDPVTARFLLPPMYKINARGAYIGWRVGFEAADASTGQLEMRYGVLDGTITVDHTRVVVNTSGRGIVQQGLLEARRRYQDKLDEGYRTGEDFGTPALYGESGVMKAHIWMKKTQKGNISKSTLIKEWPVAAQAKIDGIRLITRRLHDGKIQGRSKDNKIRYTTQHIYDEIEILSRYLPSGTEIDGELYSHDMTFSELSSVVGTGNKEGGIPHPRIREVKYYIFDIIDPGMTTPFEQRYQLMVEAYRRYIEDKSSRVGSSDPHHDFIICIVAITLANSDEELLDFHDQYVAMGYEGLMIRILALGATHGPRFEKSLYVRKRSYGLLKFKKFFDEDALVVGVDASSGKGTEEGLALLSVQDIRGNVIPAVRPRASFELRREWALNPNLVIGQRCILRYQELSEYNIPRFPIIVGIRGD